MFSARPSITSRKTLATVVPEEVALRQRVPIVNAQTGGLKPGDTKSFRLPFDTVPETWNNVMPQLVIAGIAFQ